MDRLRLMAAATAAAALIAGCGSGSSEADRPKVSPAPTALDAQQLDALTQKQALSFPLGTPRADIEQVGGTPLPPDLYAFTAQQRRACVFYAFRGPDGNVGLQNVWRFCFRDDGLESVSTAPPIEAAGEKASEPSKRKPKKGLVKPRKG